MPIVAALQKNRVSKRSLGIQRPLKVLSISHTAIKDGIGRLRYLPLAESDDIDLKLVVPNRWTEYGNKLVADPVTTLDICVSPIRLAEFGRAKWYMHYYPQFDDLVEGFHPDVIHLWEEPWSVVALQAARACKRHSPSPALILETDQNILRRLPIPFEQIRRYTLRHIDALIVRQPEALAVCRACGYEGTSVIVEYCVDTSRFYPNNRAAARHDFGVDGFTIGYAGRLAEEKGVFTVLEALRLCKHGVRFIALGDGPDRERLIGRARQLNLENRVRFLPSAPQSEVARFMNALDAFVLMSLTTRTWKEQFGRVIMEAQACGVPAIGSNSGSIPSVVGKGGWIVNESDAGALGRLLDRLVDNPSEVARAAAEGVHQANSRFSSETVSSCLRAAFIEGARHRKRSASREEGLP
jgi:glycosyltransferase involved in cell wall biosynthesis